MNKRFKAILSVLFAVMLAFVLVPGKAEAAPEDNTAFLAYADSSWTYQYWGDPVDGIAVTDAQVTGVGQYTVGLDFTGTADGKATGLAFTAPMIQGGSANFPGHVITIDKIELNGNAIDFTKGYANDEEGNLRSNIYNEWVSKLPDDARTADGNLEGASSIIIDKELFAEVETLYVTFTLSEGTGVVAQPTEAEPEEYIAPSEFTAFLMYSAAENGWEIYEPIEGVNTTTILGDGTYTVTLKGADIGATGQPSTAQVFCVDVPELAKAMLSLGKNINNYNEAKEHGLPTDLEVSVEVFVDGKKVRTKSELINYGDIEEKGTFRLELYNIWGLHGASIVDNPPLFPENILPEEEISVTFRIMGTGFNTEAALAEEAAAAEAAAAEEAAAAKQAEEAAKAAEEAAKVEEEKKTEEPAAEVTASSEDTSGGFPNALIIAIVVVAVVVVAAVVVLILKKKKS
ncbi:MAG: hypothetical protein EWM47_02865 [Anaerolineaceae bacterium]|nr:MAG: hypothetical protein EWM47_02865 [Anaerolineaceae bacterium]